MHPAGHRSPRRHASTALTAVAVASALFLGACTQGTAPKESSPAPTTSATTEAPPSPDPTPDTPEGPPLIKAGDVTRETAQTVTGTGPATVEFSLGKMSPMYSFTCADCTDAVNVDLTEPHVYMWRTTGPVDGRWLSRPVGGASGPNTVGIDANGTWTLTIADVSTLAPTSGPQSGHGPAVLKLDQAATQLDVTFAAQGPNDFLDLWIYDATTDRETTREFMTGDQTTATVDVTLPGTVFISAGGDWTITPR